MYLSLYLLLLASYISVVFYLARKAGTLDTHSQTPEQRLSMEVANA
jgi:hypothetical protein